MWFSDLATAPGQSSGPTPAPLGRRSPLKAQSPRTVGVLAPGMFTTVQDAGRRRVAILGVPRAGPCDPDAMHLANRLVGNPDDAGAIECTAVGPTLRFTVHGHLAVVGPAAGTVDLHVDGHPIGTEVVVPIAPGQVVSIGHVHSGLRAYLGISGGIETPLVVGSRSSDQLCGLGPGPLIVGDQLTLGVANPPRGLLTPSAEPPGAGHPVTLRVIAGPHPFPPAALGNLVGGGWQVGAASNRIGIRLTADGRRLGSGTVDLPSTGMVTGGPSRRELDRPHARPRHRRRLSDHRLRDHRRPACPRPAPTWGHREILRDRTGRRPPPPPAPPAGIGPTDYRMVPHPGRHLRHRGRQTILIMATRGLRSRPLTRSPARHPVVPVPGAGPARGMAR